MKFSITVPAALRAVCFLSLLTAAVGPPSEARAQGVAHVRYTEAREHRMRSEVRLPGTVEAPKLSTIAGETAGLVVERSVRTGDRVEEGQVLARLRTTQLELTQRAQEADLKEADARLKLAQRNLARARELLESEIFSRRQFDDAQSEFSAWEGRCERLRADISRVQDNVERATIRAPFSGVVVEKHTEVGQWLDAGDPVVDLLSSEHLEVSVDVPERHFRDLRPGTRVTMTFEALGSRKVTGTVSRIIPLADPQARTFPVKVSFSNRGARVVAGMLAHVTIPSAGSSVATIVPKDAIVRSGPDEFVFLFGEDGKVNRMPVRSGSGVGNWVEVRGEILPGQRVVTRGNERLRPGQQARGEPIEYELP